METSREHWHELWGTCSVKDHQRPGAFVAKVLLYDEILIPVPPTVEDGLSADEAASEWDRCPRLGVPTDSSASWRSSVTVLSPFPGRQTGRRSGKRT
jgi:hypothetical protein